jgi:YVTN family beta-propeller protein
MAMQDDHPFEASIPPKLPASGLPRPTAVSTIPAGGDPESATYDSRNGYVYVLGEEGNLTIINGTQVVGRLSFWPPGPAPPDYVLCDAGNGYVYITNAFYDNVSVVNGTNLLDTLNGIQAPDGLLYDPQNGYVYVTTYNYLTTVLNGTEIIASVDAGNEQGIAAYDDGNGLVYVPEAFTDAVSEIHGTKTVGFVPLKSGGRVTPIYATYDDRNGYVYVVNTGVGDLPGNVSVINGSLVVGAVPVGEAPSFATYDPLNGYVYLPNVESGNLSVIDGTSIVGSPGVGSHPESITYDGGNGHLYVTNGGSNNVSVVNGTSVEGSIDVGCGPQTAAYDAGNGYLYVPNECSDNVSVIPTWPRVTFTETGLPSGANWSVTLNGRRVNSTSPTIVFSEPDGNYSYALGSLGGYKGNPPTGSVIVNGTDRSIAVTFTSTYMVPLSLGILASPSTVCADGSVTCPAATGYARVTVTAVAPGNRSTLVAEGAAQPIFQFVPYGNISVAPNPQINVSCTTALGLFLNCGSTSTRNVSGIEVLDWNWSDTPSSNAMYGGDTWMASFLVYASGPPYTAVPVDACITLICRVDGSAAVRGLFTSATYFNQPNSTPVGQSFQLTSVTVEPTWATYPVTFAESGLPSGTGWSVDLNGTVVTSTKGTVDFTELNGTYPFVVNPVTGYTLSPSSGNVVVSGGNVTKAIAFTAEPPATFTVTFTESGLPNASWRVWLNGSGTSLEANSTSVASASSTISFEVPNGTYRYIVWSLVQYTAGGTIYRYTPSPASGSLVVAGSPRSVAVVYTRTSSGGPSGGISAAAVGEITVVIVAVAAVAILLTRWKRSPPTHADPTAPSATEGASDPPSSP